MTRFDDLESELSDPPEEEPLKTNSGNIESSRRPGRVKTPRTLYIDQISHTIQLVH